MRVSGLTKIGKELAKIKERKPERGIHSQMHALAKEISETFREPKKFAMYLGIIKNIGLKESYRVFSKIKHGKNITNPGKLFVYESTYRKMEILKKPAEILAKKLKEVELITLNLKKVVLKMKKTMKEANGIGLAANQIGLNMAVFVIDEELAKEYNAPSVYINPEIKPYPSTGRAGAKGEEQMEEGCLSVPDVWLQIKRPKKVKVKSVDEKGKKYKFIAKGMLARVLQHEYDHLQGVLITDK